ncbi:MAG: T9SS type A sorting domain-containing protein [Bacteroidales bacterium]
MKRLVQFTTPLFMAFFLLLSFNSFGQGTETFDNLDLTGSTYSTGTFTGQDGSTWNYVQSRGDGVITGKSIMLGKDRDPQAEVYSGTITGGIGTLTFDYMQAFSSNVNLQVLVNDVLVGTVTSSGEATDIKSSGAIEVNVAGDFVIKFINPTGGGQVVIDNVVWTGLAAVTKVSKPTISPNGGTFYEPVDVTLATSTPDATIFYSTESVDGTWTEYTAPITLDADATIWTYASADGLEDSDVGTAAFVFPVITDVATIEALRDGTVGEAYRLTGEAVLHAKDGYNNRKYLGDGTAAIMIFDSEDIITTTYEIGDGIENLTGVLGEYNNLLQLIPLKDPGTASSTGNAVESEVIAIDALSADDQAKLVTLKNVTIDATGDFATGTNYTVTDGTNTMALRTEFYGADYIGTAIPTAPQNITGVIIQYNDNMQIVPRSLADFEEYVYVEYSVTFNVHMHAAEGFDPETDVVYITGSLLGWAGPGEDPDNQVMTVSDDDPMVYTTTMTLEQGTYEYKYFLNAGWDGGEWNAGDNRTLVLDETKTLEDVFGDSTNESLPVQEIELTEVNLFPNPARDQMNIVSDQMISEIRVFDMLGQVVFTAQPESQQMVMNVSNLKAGVYLVQINTPKGTTTHRIQIQK